MTTKVYAKGQITIPQAIRESLDVKPGDSVVIEERDGEAVIRKAIGILEANGIGAPKTRKNLPWKRIEEIAWEDHIKEKFGKRDR